MNRIRMEGSDRGCKGWEETGESEVSLPSALSLLFSFSRFLFAQSSTTEPVNRLAFAKARLLTKAIFLHFDSRYIFICVKTGQ